MLLIALIFWLCIFFILYTYFGYPIAIFLLSHLKPKDDHHQTDRPSVTLMILAYNEEKVIEDKIKNSLSLDYPHSKIQILVVADGSTDKTVDKIKKYANQGVELSYTPDRQGKMAAIVRSLSFATGSIIVFSDANNSYNPTAIQELVVPFEDPEVGCVTGAKHIEKGDGALGDSEGLYWQYESFIRKQESRLGCCTGVNGEILAIRNELFEAPPIYEINDDLFTALQIIRKGYRVIYAPLAHSYERISPSSGDEIERRARIIALRYQLIAMAGKLLPFERPFVVWQIVSHKFFRPLIPFAMFGAFVANLLLLLPQQEAHYGVLRLSPPLGWLILCFQITFYCMAFVGNKQNFPSRFKKILYIPTFFVNSNFAALVGFYRFIRKEQSAVWHKIPRTPSKNDTP
ncbi:MAG: glycosyltransferase family 2 protein [Bacteroidetes bacterium]|nr:glycosyltransferase family 2 protein [Bacteroidota bacterium]